MPKHSLNFWWDSDLTNLKKQSILSHQIWINAGKPNTGVVFENKNIDKARYKLQSKTQKIKKAVVYQMNS